MPGKNPVLLRGYSYTKEKAYNYNMQRKLLCMRLETNYECNLQCIYCYSAYDQRSNISQMTFDHLKYVIDQASELGLQSISYLGGGEPFMYDNFWPFIAYLARKNIIPVIFTNAILVDEDSAKRLYDLNASVMPKFDAFSEEKQDYYTGKGSYVKIRKGFENLMRAGFNKVVGGYTRMGAGVCVCRNTCDDVPAIWRYCRDNGIFPNIEPATSIGMADNNTVIAIEQSMWIRETVKKIDHEEYGIIWPTKIYTPIVAHSCWAFLAGCGVRVNGDISACPETRINGNIFETPLKDILESEYFRKCRGYHQIVKEPCQSCDDLDVCAGGCRSKASAKTGDEFNLDPYCPKVIEYCKNEEKETAVVA